MDLSVCGNIPQESWGTYFHKYLRSLHIKLIFKKYLIKRIKGKMVIFTSIDFYVDFLSYVHIINLGNHKAKIVPS